VLFSCVSFSIQQSKQVVYGIKGKKKGDVLILLSLLFIHLNMHGGWGEDYGEKGTGG
jgi:hypothetical protein